MKPNVTSEGFLRVMFRSNNDKRVQGGARCLVECGGNAAGCFEDVPAGWRRDGDGLSREGA